MVIDFSASWCGPCRFIEPAFKELASRFSDAIFVKIDVDELAVRHASCGPDAVLLSSFSVWLGRGIGSYHVLWFGNRLRFSLGTILS